jgi:chorismate mutase
MIEKLRKQINQIDKIIANYLLKRAKIVKKIRNYKKKNNLPVTNKKREIEILKKAGKKGKYVKEIFKKIISESKKLQK